MPNSAKRSTSPDVFFAGVLALGGVAFPKGLPSDVISGTGVDAERPRLNEEGCPKELAGGCGSASLEVRVRPLVRPLSDVAAVGARSHW